MSENYNKPLALFIPGGSKKGEYKKWQPKKFAQIAKYYENLGFIICVVGTYEDSIDVLPILNICKNVINKIDQSPPEVVYSLALQSSIIISNNTGPGQIAKLANKNIIWIVNDDNITRATIPQVDNNYKILSNSVKDITVKEVIDFIERNNLY